MTASQKYELCLNVYRDIINGHSSVLDGSQELYVKHLTDRDQAHFQYKREHFQALAEEKGLLSEEDYVEMLQKTGHWSKEEEETYNNLNIEIKNLESTRDNLFLEAQRKRIEERINKKTEERDKLSQARSELKVNTIEDFSENKLHDFIVSFTFYKDRELKDLLYTEEEFDLLDTSELSELMNKFADIHADFRDEQMKLISVCPFFVNIFTLCGENAYAFFSKPIVELTNFQTSLLNAGKYSRSLIMNSKAAPEDYYESPKKLSEWYELQDKSKQVKDGLSQQGDAGGTTIVGANKSEIKSLESEDDKVVDLNKLAQEKGEISFDELMDLHGL